MQKWFSRAKPKPKPKPSPIPQDPSKVSTSITDTDSTPSSPRIRDQPSLPLRPPPPSNEFYELSSKIWNSFKVLLEDEDEAQAEKILQEFVSSFNPKYYQWNEEFNQSIYESEEWNAKNDCLPEVGKQEMKFIERLLSKFTLEVNQALMAPRTSQSKDFTDGLSYLYLINILSRVPNNLILMNEFDILSYPIQLSKFVSLKLTSLFTGRSRTVNSVDQLLPQLQIIQGYCFQIICNFTNYNNCWRTYLDEESKERMEIDSLKSFFQGPKDYVSKNSVFKIIKDNLTLLSHSISQSQGKSKVNIEMENLLLNTMGCIIFHHEESQTELREIGILELLLNSLGWPENYNPELETNQEELESSFNLQLLTLQVITHAIYKHPTNSQKFSAYGGYEKMMDLILFASVTFPSDPLSLMPLSSIIPKSFSNSSIGVPSFSNLLISSPQLQQTVSEAKRTAVSSSSLFSQNQDNIPSPNNIRLSKLFEVLYQMCISTTPPVSRSVSPYMLLEGPGSVTINRMIVSIILDIFKDEIRATQQNQQARMKLKKEFPEVQFYVIDFMSKLLLKEPVTIHLCRKYRVWDVFFSEYFIFGGPPPHSLSTSSPSLSSIPLSFSSTSTSTPTSTSTLNSISSPSFFPHSTSNFSFTSGGEKDFSFSSSSSSSSSSSFLSYNSSSSPKIFDLSLSSSNTILPTSPNLVDSSSSITSSSSTILPSSSATEGSRISKSLGWMFGLLKLKVQEFITFATSRENFDPTIECHKFLTYLDTHSLQVEVVSLLCQMLIKMLKWNYVATASALFKANGLSVIASLLERQEKLRYIETPKNDANMKEYVKKARTLTIQLLSLFISSDNVLSLYAIKNFRLTEILMNLLFDHDLSTHSLRQITSLMKVKPPENKLEGEEEEGGLPGISIIPSNSLPPSSVLPADSLTSSLMLEENDFVRFFSSFLNQFPKAQGQSDLKLLLSLLRTLRTVIEDDHRKQLLCKEAGGFVRLLTLLSSEDQLENNKKSQRLPKLCVEVLLTLTWLLENNNENKEYFRSTIRYELLKNQIVRSLEVDQQMILENQLPSLLFQMLVSTREKNPESIEPESSPISNSDMIPLIFHLIPHLEGKTQSEIFDRFIELIGVSHINQSLCCSQNLIFLLLNMIPSFEENENIGKLTDLIRILGAHSITVRELKKLFSYLKSEPGDFRPRISSLLLQKLEQMTLSRSEGPECYFDFDGKSSGLVLPKEKWFSNGFTFVTWLRIESFSDPTGRPNYNPRLWSFLSSDGQGVEAFFTQSKREGKGHLSLQIVHSSKKQPEIIAFDQIPFEEKKWYFVALAHSNYTRHPFAAPEVKLYCDRNLKQKIPLKIPPINQVLNYMRIGTNVELETSGGYCLYRETPFFGQMGTIYFFDELIPGSVIKLINTLGPNYSGVFQPHEYVPPAVSAALGGFEHHKLFDGSLASKLILSYNCRARDSLYFFDTSEATDKKIYDAQIYGNLNSCITRDVKDIIHCLGGTKVLLPLFAQLTQPLSPFKKKNIKKPPSKLKLATPPENNLLITMSGESIDSKESESEEENEQQEEEGEKGQEKENTINYSTSAEELAQVVALLKAMLSGSKTNQSELLRCRGIAVIGYCLQQVSPEHLTTNSLKEFSHLASVITLPGLLDELYINIFLNFRLWIYSKPDVQNELLTFIVEALHQRRDFFRGKYGFSFFLHILRNFYWYEPESSSQAIDPFFHPITQKIVGQRPEKDDLKKLRGKIFEQIFQPFAYDGLSSEDIQHLLGQLSDCTDSEHISELLKFLNDQLDISSPGLAESLNSSFYGSDFFLMLMTQKNDREIIRLDCLKIMSKLFWNQTPSNQTTSSLSIPTIGGIGYPSSITNTLSPSSISSSSAGSTIKKNRNLQRVTPASDRPTLSLNTTTTATATNNNINTTTGTSGVSNNNNNNNNSNQHYYNNNNNAILSASVGNPTTTSLLESISSGANPSTFLNSNQININMSNSPNISNILTSSTNNNIVSSNPSSSQFNLHIGFGANEFRLVSQILKMYPFTYESYNTLKDITLDNIRRPTGKDREVFRVPGTLLCIFELLEVAELRLKAFILQEILSLLRTSPENRTTVLQMYGWQNYLLSLLTKNENMSSGPDGQFQKQINEIITSIFESLFVHCFRTERGGWRCIEETLGFLFLMAEREVVDLVVVVRGFLHKFIQAMSVELKKKETGLPQEVSQKNSLFLVNIIHFAVIVEEFLFCTPSKPLGTHRHGTLSSTDLEYIRGGTVSAIGGSAGGRYGISLSDDIHHETHHHNQHRHNTESSLAQITAPMIISDNQQPNHQTHISNENETISSSVPSTLPSSGGTTSIVGGSTTIITGGASGVNTSSSSGSSTSNATMSGGGSGAVVGGRKLNVYEHINNEAEWEDRHLAKDFLLLIYSLTSYCSSHFNTLETISNKEKIGNGGLFRIVMRILKRSISEKNTQDCADLMPVIRILLSFLKKNSDDLNKLKLIDITYTPLRSWVNDNKESSRELPKALVPILKELFAETINYIVQNNKGLAIKEVEQLWKHLTVAEFTAELFSPDSKYLSFWNLLTNCCRNTPKIDGNDWEEVMNKRVKYFQGCQQGLEKMDLQEIQAKKKFDSELLPFHQRISYFEKEKRAQYFIGLEKASGASSRQWIRVLRSLTSECGPWGNKETIVHWKLDKTENYSRMRYKMKRNYNFDEHIGAAITTHDLCLRAPVPVQPLNVPQDLSTPSLKISSIQITAPGRKEEKVEESEVEDMTVLSGLTTENQQISSQESKVLYTTECELVTPMKVTKGRFEITTTHLSFCEEKMNSSDINPKRLSLASDTSSQAEKALKERKWNLEQLKEIHLRRYMLRMIALEIFLVDQTNFFINFFHQRERNKVFNKILSLRPSNLISSAENGYLPEEILKRSNLTKSWQMGLISNFDYLLRLNTIAGRTYNDLNQYPVFPWIISDYTSEKLDLSKESTFRDLSKPIGALNETRLQKFVERYELCADTDMKKFHYGTHYSNAAIVLYFMVRIEPFTTLLLELQGKKYDHPDRMFFSLPHTWDNALSSTSDVKELIPEFFYFPEFMTNDNGFFMGVRQNGEILGDVALPPWADSPRDFIHKNRDALESEYVSEHLNEWIDLIFGYKQKGKEAELAHNVFFYLTYEGEVDLDAIEDPEARKAMEAQINNFGQTPTQLLKKPHPKRGNLFDPIPNKISINQHLIFNIFPEEPVMYIGIPTLAQNSWSLTHISGGSLLTSDRVVTVSKSRLTALNKWLQNSAYTKGLTPFERDSMTLSRRRIGVPFSLSTCITPSCFAITPDGKTLISCGHWDNSFKLSLLEPIKTIQSIHQHKDIVTCLILGLDGKTLVTGSKDTTLIVWKLYVKNNHFRIDEDPVHILYGHSDEVTCVSLSVELDVVVSGSTDGTIIVHNLRQGNYVRSIEHSYTCPVTSVLISPQGSIVTYFQDELSMNVYSINCNLLFSKESGERKSVIICAKDKREDLVIWAGTQGKVVISRLRDLKVMKQISVDNSVQSLAVTPDERHLFIGLEDGRLMIAETSSHFS